MSRSRVRITWSAWSITVTDMPRSTRFSAISRPMYPAPMTTALPPPRSSPARKRSAASTVRAVSVASAPGIGGGTATAPVAMTSSSKPSSVSRCSERSKTVRTRRSRSIARTSVRTRMSMPA